MLQFIHLRDDFKLKEFPRKLRSAYANKTVAVIPLNATELTDLVSEFISVPSVIGVYAKFEFGLAVQSPKDGFCKSTGRNVAKSHCKLTDFKVRSVNANSKRVQVEFEPVENVVIILTLNKTTKSVRMMARRELLD
jgi:hypothetical protein